MVNNTGLCRTVHALQEWTDAQVPHGLPHALVATLSWLQESQRGRALLQDSDQCNTKRHTPKHNFSCSHNWAVPVFAHVLAPLPTTGAVSLSLLNSAHLSG